MSNEPEIIEAPETDELALLREENEALSADNEKLRAENETLEGRNRLLWGGYQGAGGLAALILLGPSLVKAARGFFGKVGAGEEPIPREESADLFAAVVRRVVAVGALGLMVAGIPAVLLYRQNGLIADQNEFFQDQNGKLQNQLLQQAKQIERQEEDRRTVRRAQLLNTIYELSDCDRSKLKEGKACSPKAPIPLRADALRVLAKLNREELFLWEADFAHLNLSEADLSRVMIRHSSFNNAMLFGARLVESDFSGSDFADAILIGANLSEAHLFGANFSNTRFNLADLTGAHLGESYLERAELFGADLSGAEGLSQGQIDQSCGDSNTQIPDDLERPEHWLDWPWRSGGIDPKGAGCPPDPTDPEPGQ